MPKNEAEPLLVKDVTLMSPGFWNGWNYNVEELKKAFVNTDWSNEDITALYLDHPENPHNAASSWIGRVKNPKQLEDGTIKGDLEIWDDSTIFKLTKAKANFGVSPRVLGKEDEESNSFLDFFFDNFSIVSKPAQSTARLHLSQDIANRLSDGLVVRQLNKEETKIEKTEKQLADNPEMMMRILDKLSQGISLDDEEYNYLLETFANFGLIEVEMAKNHSRKTQKLKGGRKQMSEEETKEEQTEESEDETESDDVEESSEELSDSDVLNIMNENLSEFNSYANELRKENPSISLKDLAKKFKAHREQYNFVEELSETEATILLKKLLGKIGISDLAKSEKSVKVDSGSKELANKIASLERMVKELSAKKASPKSVKNLTAQVSNEFKMIKRNEASEGVRELAQMLMRR